MPAPLGSRGAVLGDFTIGTNAAALCRGPSVHRRTIVGEVVEWQGRVAANGGTLSQSDVLAANEFVRATKAAGVWERLFRFSNFFGRQIQAAVVPLKGGLGFGVDASFNFVSGDYSPAIGITGDGGSKYLDTGLSIKAVNPGDFGMGAWTTVNAAPHTRRAAIASSYVPTGATDRLYWHDDLNGTGTSDFAIGNVFGGIPGWTSTGFAAMESQAPSTVRQYANGVLRFTSTAWTGGGFQPGTFNIFRNGTSFYSNHGLAGYYVGRNLDQAALYAAWAQLNKALGR